jgi:NitT/TauT family transport system permease protein
LFPKVLICALTVFFPILVNTVVGLRAVPENLRDLMRSLRASRGQMLRHLEIPAALPVFLGGLRVGATLLRHWRDCRRVCQCRPRAGFPD